MLAASAHSAGKAYKDAVAGKWFMQEDIPESEGNLIIMDAEADAEKIASMVDFVFCAVNMKKDEIKALEEKYAKLECPVVSNNSAHRWTPDVPMVVPEINADLHRRQVQLLAAELCPRAASADEIRRGKGVGLHVSGNLRRRQDV